MPSPIEDIKARIDIIDLIQSYVRLQKAGINYRALCPFHSEKTPSFFISPSRQIWHCFGGCGKGGDIFKFIMEMERCEFPEALKFLAHRAGIVLRHEDSAVRSEKNRLYDICEQAAKIFERTLLRTDAAKDYLKQRGVVEESVRAFRLGFAPQSWDFLLKRLLEHGFHQPEIEKAGLIIHSEDGSSWYDRFRSRIMFPIMDSNGRVIGFGGRIADFAIDSSAKSQKGQEGTGSIALTSDNIGSGTAKYINTPHTALYDKSQVLYGFDKAKHEIRNQNRVVVVEGYMDCLMSHQARVRNTIAVSGTALTPPQLKTLRRLCDTMVSSFDTDAAGASATARSLKLAAEFEFERRVVHIPSGKDPADTVHENQEAWRTAVAEATPVIQFYFTKAFSAYIGTRVEEKKTIAALLLPHIRELRDEVEKAHWVRELSGRLNISEEALWKEVKKTSKEISAATDKNKEGEYLEDKKVDRRALLEDRFLALLATLSHDARKDIIQNHAVHFSSMLNQILFEILSGTRPADAEPQYAATINELTFKGEVLASMRKTGTSAEEVVMCARELEKDRIREELQKLTREITEQERGKNEIVLMGLLQNFRTLSDKLKNLL